jgi:hypothetical protein
MTTGDDYRPQTNKQVVIYLFPFNAEDNVINHSFWHW